MIKVEDIPDLNQERNCNQALRDLEFAIRV
jgi:hypothetical protein